MTQLDQLLNSTVSQHGYWLINNQGSILGDLMERLNTVGLQQSILDLNDYQSKWAKEYGCARLYLDVEDNTTQETDYEECLKSVGEFPQ